MLFNNLKVLITAVSSLYSAFQFLLRSRFSILPFFLSIIPHPGKKRNQYGCDQWPLTDLNNTKIRILFTTTYTLGGIEITENALSGKLILTPGRRDKDWTKQEKNTYIYFYISPISWLEKTNFRQGLKKTCSSSFSQKLSINIYVKLGRIFNLLKWTTRSSTKILCLRVNFNVFPSLKGTWKRALWGHASLKSRDVVLVF